MLIDVIGQIYDVTIPRPGTQEYDWYVCHGKINDNSTIQFESTTKRYGS